jgi:PIF1-like helicase
MSNEEASKVLHESEKRNEMHEAMRIPLRSDGTEYKIEDLQVDQKESMALILNAVRRYSQGLDVNDEKVLRVTVSGVAGSGKSTWINTLVTSLRKLFPESNTVSVFAPTGSAAFNAGGKTLHGGFKVPLNLETLNLSPNNHKFLLQQFDQMLVLIVDERSMMDATMLGTIKNYMQQCAHSATNGGHPWGGIPIIILVGDDFQLPPILAGAIYALNQGQLERTAAMNFTKYTVRAQGFAEFLEIGKKVLFLEGEKRVNEGQQIFKRMLRAVRCEHANDQMTEEDVQTLLKLDLSHPSFTQSERREIEDDATYVFANKIPRDTLNSYKLKKINFNCNPIARIKSKTMTNAGKIVVNESHYDLDRQPNKVLICKDSRVTLNGYNPDPKNGLFHGSLGIVRDIVYDSGKTPQANDFPAYVLVEFYQYCGDDMIPNMPRFVPVTMHSMRCNRNCCVREYMPLALAYGKTAHTFQGQNVGPVSPGRPENPIKRIIVDPGKRQFEGQNVGLFYQLLSRATTIGDTDDKLSSAIYFDGPHFSRRRFEKLTMKNDKEMYKKAKLRKDWVEYLRQHEVQKGQWTEQEMEELFEWTNKTQISNDDLNAIILNHSTNHQTHNT